MLIEVQPYQSKAEAPDRSLVRNSSPIAPKTNLRRVLCFLHTEVKTAQVFELQKNLYTHRRSRSEVLELPFLCRNSLFLPKI